jgi:hypothetical protein
MLDSIYDGRVPTDWVGLICYLSCKSIYVFRQDIPGKVVHLVFGFQNYLIDILNIIIG